MAAVSAEAALAAWTSATGVRLSAANQAKAWALREVWRDDGKGDHGLLQYVAGKVTNGNGKHPSYVAVKDLFAKMDADPDWYPGKA